EQVVSVWAGLTGLLDNVPVPDILRFERELLDWLRDKTEVLQTIAATNLFPDDLKAAAQAGVEQFKRQFRTADGRPLDDLAKAKVDLDADVDQEQIVAGKKR
ncbi:MAG: F0F1 ATP synthase subunit alpha, partial [Propionibacteriaceae bacterium]|nr:F0F1 ATP synthase subunit alpha [Propionibacteriaceae bacterium]